MPNEAREAAQAELVEEGNRSRIHPAKDGAQSARVELFHARKGLDAGITVGLAEIHRKDLVPE